MDFCVIMKRGIQIKLSLCKSGQVVIHATGMQLFVPSLFSFVIKLLLLMSFGVGALDGPYLQGNRYEFISVL